MISFAPRHRDSLQIRVLAPLLGVATAAALLVTAASWWFGQRSALLEMEERFASIESTVARSTFPLKSTVLESLSGLTKTQWVALDAEGNLVSATLPMDDQDIGQFKALRPLDSGWYPIRCEGARFMARAFRRVQSGYRVDGVTSVAVLFPRSKVDAAARQAALFPLATGLSTIVVVCVGIWTILVGMIRRLNRLQKHVERIAQGDFDARLEDANNDELGRLSRAANVMAGQLDQLWQQVHAQQGEKLLHQISGGMAHQLRNTLTGARMAMELHQSSCPIDDQQDIDVAVDQIQQAENYIQRLLSLGAAGAGAPDAKPATITQCIDDLRSTHRPVAQHLRVKLIWDVRPETGDQWVSNGSSFCVAVSNLVLNALQVASVVEIRVSSGRSDEQAEQCRVQVIDNGPGIDPVVADRLFEPFVTSKPEGMGLGLPLAQRCVDELGGQIDCRGRDDGTSGTIFEFFCAVKVTKPK
ncbi:sensor histidine kinase [Crateriforma spongiae]|uniref:sensor histidine kinase n=1 Tax=Crateriforma spongiae TaxID=2724528 RepID=UPI001444CBC7|nr:HAMP domain-containing sensor histidine kinase [Crateriforma spongiae]